MTTHYGILISSAANYTLIVAQSLFYLIAVGPQILTVFENEQFAHAEKPYFKEVLMVSVAKFPIYIKTLLLFWVFTF